jgi:crossover junction endodeoxyribonuclease RusA
MSQLGLPGVPKPRKPPSGRGGAARWGPRAAPSYSPGTLPLAWRTTVHPADVLCHISVPGEPVPKGRPRVGRAKVSERTGNLIQPPVYTPPETRLAEERWAWIMRAARTMSEPVAHPVALLAFFKVSGSGGGDGDNFVKLLLDAGNGVLWADDKQCVEHHVHLLRNCTEPGTELLVWLSGRRRPGG